MTMPNFLIIGTAKSGTTSLYNYLRQHPEIYMSLNKEPRFFVYDGQDLDPQHPIHHTTINKLEAYQALFDGVSNEKAIGEASPAYLVEPRAPVRIHHYIPDVKLIAILRNPAERAYSHFLHLIKNNYEPCHDFNMAFENLDELRIGSWYPRRDYLLFGYYYINLKRYFDIFDQSQIKVILFEDFKSDTVSIVQDIFRFLEVDDSFVPDVSQQYSASGIPRSRMLHNFLSKPIPLWSFIKPILTPFVPRKSRQRLLFGLKKRNLRYPPLTLKMRNHLIDLYLEDIMKLQELLKRDLSKWIE